MKWQGNFVTSVPLVVMICIFLAVPATGWSEIVIQPEPVLTDDGYYDALTLTLGISVGTTASCFSVSFDWLGTGKPGSHLYHIVDPDNHLVRIDFAYTVPDLMALLILGLSGLSLRRRH